MAPAQNPLDLFASEAAPAAKLDARERLPCLRLIRSENIGPVTFRELIACFGGAHNAIEALPELSRRGGRARIRICPASEAEAELDAAATLGAAPLFVTEPDYPPLLAAIDAPPPMVYVKGRADIFSAPAVAIVGSRLCSAAGAKLASQFAAGISRAGYAVVSGLARGIDRIAHEASLAGDTVAVLAGGIDKVYPPGPLHWLQD